MGSFFESMSSIPPPFNMIVWIVLISCVTGMVSAFAREVRKFACHQQDLAFKRQMVDQGYDASEIERVVSARPSDRR